MKDYKQRTEDFIETINEVISDPLMFPEYKGGKFELKYNVQVRRAVCDLVFKEDESIHSIMHSACVFAAATSNDVDSFYERCYWQILRYILFSEDAINNNEEGGYPNILSLKTLASEGLNKISNK